MIARLGKYTIVERLGEGAMGAVYKAYDEILDRHVAIKTMAEDIKWDPELKLRFYREARSVASLHHPNIVTIHDLGEDGKLTYIVMELLQGKELKGIIKEKIPMTLEKKLSIMIQAADGLSHAHAHGKSGWALPYTCLRSKFGEEITTNGLICSRRASSSTSFSPACIHSGTKT